MKFPAFVRAAAIAGALSLPSLIAFAPFAAVPAADPPPIVTGGYTHNEQVERQIARLQAKLQITTGQMTQWNALVAAMRENARLAKMGHDNRAKLHLATIIDELRAERLATQARLERLERVIPVAEALYAVLTEKQRSAADEEFTPAPEPDAPLFE
jgi:hypothetical protein